MSCYHSVGVLCAQANELLLCGHKITALQACQAGLLSQVFWPTNMMQEVIPRVQNLASQSARVLSSLLHFNMLTSRDMLPLPSVVTCSRQGAIQIHLYLGM